MDVLDNLPNAVKAFHTHVISSSATFAGPRAAEEESEGRRKRGILFLFSM